MYSDLEEVLNNKKINDVLCGNSYIKMVLHKENYRDRFIILYTKNYKDSLNQNNFEVSGYYDLKEKVIYNCSSNLKNLLPDDSKIKVDNFMSLEKKMFNDIDEYVGNYILQNDEYFKDAAIAKHNYSDDYRLKHYESEVEKEFITKEKPCIKLGSINSCSVFYREDFYYDTTMHDEYLFSPNDTIEKYSKVLLEKEKTELGLKLLSYEAKREYLNKIMDNKNNKYSNLYLNKKILESISPADAKNLNITIKYGEKETTFKYDYSDLYCSLSNGVSKTNHYGQNYSKVRDFFSNNDIRDESGKIETEFSFSNITSISHGKNVLYSKDAINKELENDDFDLER